MDKFVYNSRLSFIKPQFNGNRVSKGRFTNFPYPNPDTSFKKVLQWKLQSNPQKQEKLQDNFKLTTHFLKHLPTSPERYLVWLGHASFLVRLGSSTILIDPVLGNLPFLSRKAALPIAAETLKGINYILISHAHRDHFDVKSLKVLLQNNPGVELLGPMRMGSLFSDLGAAPTHQEAAWYQRYETKAPFQCIFLPAIHWHRRGLLDLNKILWGSFYLSDGTTSLYFAGDTAYQKHFNTIEAALGPVDVCLMPVGAYKPEFLMEGSHLSPTQAVQAFNQLKGKVMIPMHYGTFNLSDEPPGEPLRMLEQLNQQKQINGELKVLQPGEIYGF